jgi:dTDP-glucose 4,6-dehydratase
LRKLLVTGGAGFIGSNFVHHWQRKHSGERVVVLDALTYAGNRASLKQAEESGQFRFVHGDIRDTASVEQLLREERIDVLVHFAAESHVDRSIEEPGEFITTDVFGTYVLLETARDAGVRHLQVSTDEVYGDFELGTATEESPLNPSSPYSAAKAGGDLLVSAFARTYDCEALIIRASNNYGPRQHPEKLIPLCILNALAGDPLPVYGDGMQVRNWLFVEDCCAAIDAILERGDSGQIYNVGGPDELPNLEVVKRILALTDRDESLIEYVTDRPGHDRRYSLSAARLEALGWTAAVSFDEGIERTVIWYRENERWWAPIRSGEYRAYYERQYGKALGAGSSADATGAG